MTFISGILLIFDFSNSHSFGPAQYGAQCMCFACPDVSPIRCLAIVIRPKGLSHISLNSYSTLRNLSQYCSKLSWIRILCLQSCVFTFRSSVATCWCRTFCIRLFYESLYWTMNTFVFHKVASSLYAINISGRWMPTAITIFSRSVTGLFEILVSICQVFSKCIKCRKWNECLKKVCNCWSWNSWTSKQDGQMRKAVSNT